MSEDIFADPADTREEILAATYRSLCAHGYADLSIQKIGAEFPKSPSLVYHHYDNKDDLVIACLEYLLSNIEENLTRDQDESAREEIDRLVTWALGAADDRGDETALAALVELRGRAPHNADFRHYFRRSDEVFETYICRLIESGIQSGEFAACDAESIARTVHTMITGAIVRRSTTLDAEALEPMIEEVGGYLAERLVDR